MKKIILLLLIMIISLNGSNYANNFYSEDNIPRYYTVPRYYTNNPSFRYTNINQTDMLNIVKQYIKCDILNNGLIHIYCSPKIKLNNVCYLDYYITNPYNYRITLDDAYNLAVRKYNLMAHNGLYDVLFYDKEIVILLK